MQRREKNEKGIREKAKEGVELKNVGGGGGDWDSGQKENEMERMKSLYRRLERNERQNRSLLQVGVWRGSSVAKKKDEEGVMVRRGNCEGVRSFLYLNVSL